MVSEWEFPGSDECPIRGSTHLPDGDARGVVVIVHGYMGFKDYGMFPWLAARMCEQGLIVHRVNLAHSGMDHGQGQVNDDAFRRGTWSSAVLDILRVVGAVQQGVLAGQGLGLVLLGHSRGGSSCLLTAGRHGRDELMQMVCGVISLSAPSSLRRFSEEALAQLGRGEVFELASSRTGQTLHVDPIWLYEQDNDPDAHDLQARVGEIIVPVLVIHGAEDPTVSPSDAVSLASANPARVWVHIVEHGDHVFNTPNPFAPGADPSPELADAWGEIDRTLEVWFS